MGRILSLALLLHASQASQCGGEWDHPRGCRKEGKECQYLAQWEFTEATDRINFTITSRNPAGSNLWTGIGFSDSPSMRLTDAIIGWVEPSGEFFIMDLWATSYLSPVLDESQDVSELWGGLEDGVTTLRFSRARDTGDRGQDVAFTDTEGRYLIFPVQGGGYNPQNKRIRMHEQDPIPSSERILIRSCRNPERESSGSTFTTTPRPAEPHCEGFLRFLSLGCLLSA